MNRTGSILRAREQTPRLVQSGPGLDVTPDTFHFVAGENHERLPCDLVLPRTHAGSDGRTDILMPGRCPTTSPVPRGRSAGPGPGRCGASSRNARELDSVESDSGSTPRSSYLVGCRCSRVLTFVHPLGSRLRCPSSYLLLRRMRHLRIRRRRVESSLVGPASLHGPLHLVTDLQDHPRGQGAYDVGWLANLPRVATPKRNFVSRYMWFAQFLQADEGWITLTEPA